MFKNIPTMFKNITSWSRALGFGHGRIASTARKSPLNTSHKLQSAIMIPFDNSSLVTPSPVVPMIFETRENNHRRDSNQAQDDAMSNNHQGQGEGDIWAEAMSERRRRLAATPFPGPFDRFDRLSGNDFLEILANFDLKSSTIDSLDSILTKKMDFLFHPADMIDFGCGRLISCPVYDGSLNPEEIPPNAEPLHCLTRIITVVLHSGLQISFHGLVLGRLTVNCVRKYWIPTYWIVVLDEEKHLWALRASGVDEEELDDDDDWMDDPMWPAPQYEELKDLFGTDSPVVRLCSLASLQRFRKSGQQFSPKPYYGVKCWTSRWTLVEGPATAAAEES